MAVSCLVGNFLWTCFPGLLSWYILSEFLLVLKAGIIGNVGEMEDWRRRFLCSIGDGVREERETTTDVLIQS